MFNFTKKMQKKVLEAMHGGRRQYKNWLNRSRKCLSKKVRAEKR